MTCLKPIKNPFFYVLFLVGSLVAGLISGNSTLKAQSFPVEVVKVETTKGAFFFSTEMAVTEQQREQGLMFRQSMARDEAMLFWWDVVQPVRMWMKNTYISLDIVFISKNGRVVNIVRATTPHSLAMISSKGKVMAVLELIAGTAEQIGLAEGDMVFHRMFR